MSYIKENLAEFEICNILRWHELGYTGKGIKIANLEKANPDLWFFDGKVSCPTGYIYDKFENYHGNQTMDCIHQVAPDADLITLSNAANSSNNYIEGAIIDVSIPYMVNNGVHLVNASLGGNDIKMLNDIIVDAQSYGVVFCTSAGNVAEKGLKGYAKSNKWISVGAVHYYDHDKKTKLATYSSRGKELDISCFSNLHIHDARKDYKGRTFPVEGTSFSSPMFTGMLALVQQFFLEKIGRTLYQDEIELFIQDHVVDLGDIGWDENYGYGLFVLPEPNDINVEKYLLRGKPPTTIPTEPEQPTNPNPPIENNPPIQNQIKDILSDSDYSKYINFKGIYDGAKKDGNKVAMDYAKQSALALLNKYGLKDEIFDDEVIVTPPIEEPIKEPETPKEPELPVEPEKPIEVPSPIKTYKIGLNAGHSLNTSGKRCLKSIDLNETREWFLNNRIAVKIEEKLKNYDGIEVYRLDDRTGQIDVPLKERTDKANELKLDFVDDIHHNAGINGGSGGGIIVIRNLTTAQITKDYQDIMYDKLIKYTGLKGNRSTPKPTQDLHMCRETKMPTLTVEHGFMDSTTDTPIILTEEFAEQCANAHVEFYVEVFNLKKKEVTVVDTETLYRVQVGAFKNRDNAEKLLNDLKKAGFNGFIASVEIEVQDKPKEEVPKEDNPNKNPLYRTIRKFNSDVHILEVNPNQYHVDIDLGQRGKLEKLSTIVQNKLSEGKKVIAGTNAGFFNFNGSSEHLGMYIDEGLYYNQPSQNFIDFIYFKDGHTEIHNHHGYDQKLLSGYQATTHWAIGTSYSLVQNGKINLENTDKFDHANVKNPRTMIGQKQDGTFVLVVADGRTSKSSGLTAKEQAQIMLELGCYNSASCDGGGSSCMVLVENNKPKVINKPSDGIERNIGSAFVVYKKK